MINGWKSLWAPLKVHCIFCRESQFLFLARISAGFNFSIDFFSEFDISVFEILPEFMQSMPSFAFLSHIIHYPGFPRIFVVVIIFVCPGCSRWSEFGTHSFTPNGTTTLYSEAYSDTDVEPKLVDGD